VLIVTRTADALSQVNVTFLVPTEASNAMAAPLVPERADLSEAKCRLSAPCDRRTAAREAEPALRLRADERFAAVFLGAGFRRRRLGISFLLERVPCAF
jgi:hypothetical protein